MAAAASTRPTSGPARARSSSSRPERRAVGVGRTRPTRTDCGSPAARRGEVRVYDASTGELLETYDLGHVGFLNDLVVTDTAVYVTDSPFDHLDVLPFGPNDALPDPADVHQLTLGGDFELLPGFNLNGIVEARGWLIAVQSNGGKLWRIDPEDGEATEIALGAGVNVTAGDGLELHGRTLYVVQNQLNRVAVFELGPQLLSATRVALLGDARSGSADRALRPDDRRLGRRRALRGQRPLRRCRSRRERRTGSRASGAEARAVRASTMRM